MTINRRRLLGTATLAVLAFATHSNFSYAADVNVNIGYQPIVEPSRVPQADGTYEKVTGAKINWQKFDSGADVITAIASGSLDIGYVGSSPLAAAASREIPIETIFVVGLISEAEALAVKGIDKPEDLAGKKIATPFVSTAHYSLLTALKHWKVDPKSVEILNLRPPEIAAAWERGDIDGAYVWDPVLSELKKTGSVLATSADVAGLGRPDLRCLDRQQEICRRASGNRHRLRPGDRQGLCRPTAAIRTAGTPRRRKRRRSPSSPAQRSRKYRRC